MLFNTINTPYFLHGAVDERGYAALRIRDVVNSPEDLETDDFEVNEGSVFDERRRSWYVPNYPLVKSS